MRGLRWARMLAHAISAVLILRLVFPRTDAQAHRWHVRRWAATLHGRGLGPRSIALVLSAWRGFYRGIGRDGLIAMKVSAGRPQAQADVIKLKELDR